MSVCHYLFWIENKRITVVLNKEVGFDIIKIGGNTSIEYTEDFWDIWKEYAGFLKNDFTDFCFIYDEMPYISDELKKRECSIVDCIWNKYSIQEVVSMLENTYPTLIFNENGVCVAKTGRFKNTKESEIKRLTVSYRDFETDDLTEESELVNTTEFIEEMLEKLKEYDKEN